MSDHPIYQPDEIDEEPPKAMPQIEGKMPSNLDEQLEKLNLMVKQMEFNVEQNQKRCEFDSSECYNLLRSTELLAFDVLFAHYLLGEVPPNDIYDFFNHCTMPTFDLSSGVTSEYEKAAAHIQYLKDIFQAHSSALLSLDLKQPTIPKKISEFYLYLKDQKLRLDNQLRRRSQNEEKLLQEKLKKEEEEDENDTNGLVPAFSKWLSTELKVGLERDEQTIEITCLIRTITRKLNDIVQIKDEIDTLQQDKIEYDPNDSSHCRPEDINNSVYYKGAQNSIQYLSNLLSLLKREKELINECEYIISYCHDRLKELIEPAQKSILEISVQMAKLQAIHDQKQKDVAQIEAELQPFIALYYTESRKSQISPPPPNLFHHIEDMLITLIQQNPNDQKLLLDKNALQELIQYRNEIHYYNNEMNKLYEQVETNDRQYLELQIDKNKAEEEVALMEQEKEQLKRYEIGLRDVHQLISFEELSEWLRKLSQIIENVARIQEDQKMIQPQLSMKTSTVELQKQIETKAENVEKLHKKNYQMSHEIARSKIDLIAIKEEKFRAQKELEFHNDFVPSILDRSKKDGSAKHMKMIMCPVCKKNRRDLILTTCRHPLCHECISQANGACPICNTAFTQNNIRPIFFQ